MITCACLGEVVFDFDGTIAVRNKLPDRSLRQRGPGWRITEWEGELYEFKIRPSARACFEQLIEADYELAVLTYSNKPGRSAHFLAVAGLSDLIPRVYGRDSVVPDPEVPWLLVDNLPASTDSVRHKVNQLGLNNWYPDFEQRLRHHVLTCFEYTGADDRFPLTALRRRISNKLFTQHGWRLGAAIA